MDISEEAIQILITKFGAKLRFKSGHTKSRPTLIFDFPSFGGYQLAMGKNKQKLSVYLNAKSRNGKTVENFLPIGAIIEKRYPQDGKPAHGLLSEEKAKYLTPHRHKLLLIKVPIHAFSGLISEYLGANLDDHQDKNEHSPFSSNPISADNSGESSIATGIETSGDNSKVGEDISTIQRELESAALELNSQFEGVSGKDVDVIAKRRVGQGPFRTLLIAKHGGRCCISGLGKRELLIASHIVRWSKSDPYQKTDSENGLLLSVSWDSVFDKGFVSFDGQGNLLCSDLLDQESARLLGISTDAKLPPELLTDRRKQNLSWHRENIFRGDGKNTDS